MSKKTLLALLLLLPCVCQAGRYDEDIYIFTESVLNRNYNVRFGVAPVVSNKENFFFSFDLFYFRFMKDTATWRFYTPFPLFVVCLGIGISPGANPPPRNKFDSLYYEGIIPLIPMMLANPTVGLKLTEWLNIAVGYNTDFCIIPRAQIYFAPKIQLGLAITQNFLLSTILSYQVVDSFATKRGFHIGLSLAVREPRDY